MVVFWLKIGRLLDSLPTVVACSIQSDPSTTVVASNWDAYCNGERVERAVQNAWISVVVSSALCLKAFTARLLQPCFRASQSIIAMFRAERRGGVLLVAVGWLLRFQAHPKVHSLLFHRKFHIENISV